MQYDKKWTSIDQQIDLLKSQNLLIGDSAFAAHCLSHIGLTRFSTYFPTFFEKNSKEFRSTTSFEQVLNLYQFDKELRLLVFDAVETIEVSMKAQIVNYLSEFYGPFFLHNQAVFNKNQQLEIDECVKLVLVRHRNDENIKEFRVKYYDSDFMPAWLLFNYLSFGDLSKIYKSIKEEKHRRNLAQRFGLPEEVHTSWLHTLNYVRNICGHHSRLWNRKMGIGPIKLNTKKLPHIGWLKHEATDNRYCYYSLCIIKFYLNIIKPENAFTSRLISLFDNYPDIPYYHLGIPFNHTTQKLLDWQNEPVWQG